MPKAAASQKNVRVRRDLPWFRLYSEAVDDEKLRLLAFEDRWHFIALLCCKSKGIQDEGSDIARRKIAVKLGLDLRSLEEVARRLSEVGLVDQNTLQPLAWDHRQFKSDSSTDRVKAYRERIKNDVKRYRNVPVTTQEAEGTSATYSAAIGPVFIDGKWYEAEEVFRG